MSAKKQEELFNDPLWLLIITTYALALNDRLLSKQEPVGSGELKRAHINNYENK